MTEVSKKTGIKRLLYTFINSANGFKWMSKHEAAFQQELMLFIPLTLLVFVLETTLSNKALLIGSLLFVLFAELVNTAIEVIIDRIGTEFNELSGIAKDIGSAAVFLAMLITCLVWLSVLCAA